MNKRGFRRLLFSAAVLMAGASLSQASTLTYWVDVFGSGVPQTTLIPQASATEAAAGTSVTLAIPKLDKTDPNPGFIYALSAVNLTLEWISNGQLTLLNLSCQGIPAGGCQDLPFSNSSSVVTSTLHVDGVTVVADGSTAAISGTAKYGTSFPNGGGDGGPTNVYSGLSGSGTNSNAAADVSFFEGFGSSTISASVTNSIQQCTSPSNLPCLGNSETGAILVVNYTYAEQAVPEPVTSALVGGSLLGLGLLARRKRAKKA